jgi:hypothetical protein
MWPIRYRIITREGDYIDSNGKRIDFTTSANGIVPNRHVSQVLLSAYAISDRGYMLLVIGGIGYRRVAGFMEVLFHVNTSKSS